MIKIYTTSGKKYIVKNVAKSEFEKIISNENINSFAISLSDKMFYVNKIEVIEFIED